MIVEGRYVHGCGRAHFSSSGHEPIFGHSMIGTFNVRTEKSIEKFTPSIISQEYGRRYWKVLINDKYEAWAFRWNGSGMRPTTWELVSRESLPAELKRGTLKIEIVDGAK